MNKCAWMCACVCALSDPTSDSSCCSSVSSLKSSPNVTARLPFASGLPSRSMPARSSTMSCSTPAAASLLRRP
eukprot:233113-Pleurochrysis_carterae.AAC.1